ELVALITGEALDGLKGSFKDVFSSVPTDMGSASTAIADLNTRLGLTGDPLESLSTQFLNLSRITGSDLPTDIESVSRAFGDWGVVTGDQGDKLDALFRASQATGPSVDSLAQMMVKFGSPLRQLGFGFDTTAALLGKFEKEGVNTELVLGSLRIALGKMARDGEPAEETLGRVMDQIQNAGSVSEANALALELFGARAGPDMAAAIREGRFELGDLLDTVSSGSETINTAAEDTLDWLDKWKLLVNKTLVKLEPLAMRVMDGLGAALDWLTPRFEQVVAWVEENWPKIEATARHVFEWIRDNVGPIVEAAAAIATAAFGEIKLWVDENWPAIRDTIAAAVEGVRTVVETVVTIVSEIWTRYGEQIVSVLKSAWETAKSIVSAAIDFIRGVIQTVTGLLKGDWEQVWNGIKTALGGVWDAMVAIVENAINVIWQVIQAAWDTVLEITGATWELIKTAISTAIDAIVSFVTGIPGRIADTIANLWNGLTEGVESAKTWVGERIDLMVGFVTGIPDRIRYVLAGLWAPLRSS
ncbi:MAG: phage tail tape measure protein, partial [Actinomycetota bacterium]